MNLFVDAASGQVADYQRDWRHPPEPRFSISKPSQEKPKNPKRWLETLFVGLIFFRHTFFLGERTQKSCQNLEEQNTADRDLVVTTFRGLLDADFTLLRSSSGSGVRKICFRRFRGYSGTLWYPGSFVGIHQSFFALPRWYTGIGELWMLSLELMSNWWNSFSVVKITSLCSSFWVPGALWLRASWRLTWPNTSRPYPGLGL